MEAREFSLKEVTDGLKIPRERFKEWVLRGFVTASIQQKQGARTFNSYTEKDIYAIALFKHLVEHARLPREFSRWMVEKAREHSWENIEFVTITHDPPHSDVGFYRAYDYAEDGEEPVPGTTRIRLEIPNSYDTLYIINLKKIMDQVKAAFSLV
jgi:hypothetical protein